MRPDIHLLHYEVCTVVILPYMVRLPQKIEFGSTRQPRNSITLHCKVGMHSPLYGED